MIKQLAAKDIKSYLKVEPNSVLLDVRTNEEWVTIGKPEGGKIGLKTYFLSIQFGKERIFNQNFIQEFKSLAINQDQKHYHYLSFRGKITVCCRTFKQRKLYMR